MTYEEALMALERAQSCSWQWPDLSIHDGITQAIEIFKRMKIDLDDASQPSVQEERATTCAHPSVVEVYCGYLCQECGDYLPPAT